MLWLPQLPANCQVLSLPLSHRTADGLAAAILSGRPGACDRSLVAETLAADAPLALWTALRMPESAASSTPTPGELADWLAAHALAEFAPLAATASNCTVPSDGMVLGCDLLAARSLAVARAAQARARAQNLQTAGVEQAYLFGLLHAAPEWLAACAAEPSTAPEQLPAWLSGALDSINAGVRAGEESADASPAGCVAWAIRQVASQVDTAGPSPSGDRPLAASILPQVLARELQLVQLTERFAETLEREKLESLKELAYGASHEINNPLANISARAQTLLPGERDPDRRRMLAAIQAQAARAHEMIADMMLFARPPRPKLASCDLGELLRALHAELAPLARDQQTELALDVPGHAIEIWADRLQIAVAVRAVCLNALEALVTGGQANIALAKSASSDDSAQITVSDNGPGVTPEARRHLFDPFYSGREAGRGLGFGLSKCWRIVMLHGGRIEVESTPACGARFTIFLPSAPPTR